MDTPCPRKDAIQVVGAGYKEAIKGRFIYIIFMNTVDHPNRMLMRPCVSFVVRSVSGSCSQTMTMRNAFAQPCPTINNHQFLVGQDHAGHWVVIETHGLGSGLFRSREAAVRYAASETDHRPGAVQIVRQPLELKI